MFQITGTSTRPFQLTVEKLEKALQDAQAEVSIDELHLTGQGYSMFEMAGLRCDLKSKTFSKPSTWLSHGPYRPEVRLLANPACSCGRIFSSTSWRNPTVSCIPGHALKCRVFAGFFLQECQLGYPKWAALLSSADLSAKNSTNCRR